MNVPEYTLDQQAKIEKLILVKLRKSFSINKFGKGTPLWMNIAFLLDTFNRGNHYGTIEVKILGTSCNDAREREITHKLLEIYRDPAN